jgi:hypothetical protein
MSDETGSTIHDGDQGWAADPAATPNPDAPKAFCQDCGRPLTAETLRTVGTGVFCEPCLHARVAAATPYVAPVVPGEPSPALATLLGFIPGVGAMYNGQYAKGFAHLIIFALLVSLGDHVNGIFGFFCFAWYCYMVFDAYHTAKARVEGLPLPNPFGLNDIGERIGYGRSWTAGAPPNQPPATAAGAWTATASPQAPPPPPPYAPPTAGPGWVGYVPPTEFGAAAQHRVANELLQPAIRDTYGAPTYTGAPATDPAVPYVAPAATAVPSRRLPVAAFVLIGLGALILIGTLVPEWSINGRWFPPVLFAALSLFLLQRRLRYGRRLVCHLRWPVVLMVLAVMTGLHAAGYDAATFGLTFAVLLIAMGALLLLERTVGAAPVYPYAPPVTGEAPRASFTSAGPAPAQPTAGTADAPKDGE